MSELNGILKDLDLCVGCYACEVACKQENNVPLGQKWIRIIPVGPETIHDNLHMDFLTEMTDECTSCHHRVEKDLLPRCVDNCPMDALRFCRNSSEILAALRNERRIQVCKIKGKTPYFV